MEKVVSAPALIPPKDTRLTRRLLYVRHLLKRALLIRRGCRLISLGDKNAGCTYAFCPDWLGADSVVYSGGVGKDISFEHALVKQFGCSVVMFDPSPIGLATMKLPQNSNPKFKFFPVGLAGQCGTLRLSPPFTLEGDSYFSHDSAVGTIQVPCLDLLTLMKENGHQHVDLLKIDIEGAEYGVINQILEQRISVRQILVEFHDGILPGVTLSQSLRTLFKLLGRGYELLSEEGQVHTFARSSAWKQ